MLIQHIINYTALYDQKKRNWTKATTVVDDQFCIAGGVLHDKKQAMANGWLWNAINLNDIQSLELGVQSFMR